VQYLKIVALTANTQVKIEQRADASCNGSAAITDAKCAASAVESKGAVEEIADRQLPELAGIGHELAQQRPVEPR
jgi:hypothetical protein